MRNLVFMCILLPVIVYSADTSILDIDCKTVLGSAARERCEAKQMAELDKLLSKPKIVTMKEANCEKLADKHIKYQCELAHFEAERDKCNSLKYSYDKSKCLTKIKEPHNPNESDIDKKEQEPVGVDGKGDFGSVVGLANGWKECEEYNIDTNNHMKVSIKKAYQTFDAKNDYLDMVVSKTSGVVDIPHLWINKILTRTFVAVMKDGSRKRMHSGKWLEKEEMRVHRHKDYNISLVVTSPSIVVGFDCIAEDEDLFR